MKIILSEKSSDRCFSMALFSITTGAKPDLSRTIKKTNFPSERKLFIIHEPIQFDRQKKVNL